MMKKILKIMVVTVITIFLLFFLLVVGIMIKDSITSSAPKENNETMDYEESTHTTEDEYLDVELTNEFTIHSSLSESKPIEMSAAGFTRFVDGIKSTATVFSMSRYYCLDECLKLYNSANVNKSKVSTLLNASGNLDSALLFDKVISNNDKLLDDDLNSVNMFYQEMDAGEIRSICETIATVVNDRPYEVSIADVANTLQELTIVQRTGSASNAYVNNNLTFVFNPNMTELYGNMNQLKGTVENAEDSKALVIVHEIMHLLQYGTSDNDSSNGIEAGICRMYNVPNLEEKVDSDALWFSWLLEASAEIGMADYLQVQPTTYGKKISYVNSYNLSRFYQLKNNDENLETVAFKSSLEEAFQSLKINSDYDRKEFLNFMYSVEITQSDPKTFWKIYETSTGNSPSEDEKLSIRKKVRMEAVRYMSENFYINLASAISNGEISDLNSLFYMMRLWELDVYSHLEYNRKDSFQQASEYIKWHAQSQNLFFHILASENGLSVAELEKAYDDFTFLVEDDDKSQENCTLGKEITNLRAGYSSSKFTRISDMVEYIDEKTAD